MHRRSRSAWDRWACVVCFTLLLLMRTNAVRAGTVEVIRDKAWLNFPTSIIFSADLISDLRLERAILLHGITGSSCMESQARQQVEIDPEARDRDQVSIEWEWDLTYRGGLPPGVEVWWQWEIYDEAGLVLTTERQFLTIADPKYDWHVIQQGSISLQYAEGGYAFGSNLMQMASSSLERLSTNVGLQPDSTIRMTIYPSAYAMHGALVGLVQWAGGVAFPEFQVILIGIAPDEGEWAELVIPHELTHLITEMRVFNCQGSDLPHWLHEGLAEYAEGPVPDGERETILSELEAERLGELTALAKGFPADGSKAEQAYRHSRMVVTFLVEEYGPQNLDALLDAIQSGQRIDPALRGVYGFDTDGLDQTWRASLGFGEAPEPDFATPARAASRTRIPTMAIFEPDQDTPTPEPSLNDPTLQQPAPTRPLRTATATSLTTARTTASRVPTRMPASPTAVASSQKAPIGATAGAAAVILAAGLAAYFFILPTVYKKN